MINERQRISEILAITEYRESKPIGIEDIKSEVKTELQYADPEADLRLNQYYKDAVNSTFLVKEVESLLNPW